LTKAKVKLLKRARLFESNYLLALVDLDSNRCYKLSRPTFDLVKDVVDGKKRDFSFSSEDLKRIRYLSSLGLVKLVKT